MRPKKIAEIIQKTSEALFRYCQKNNIHHTITGVSGGLDSAVTLALAQKAAQLGKKHGFDLTSIGLILPCHSDPLHTKLGKKVIKTFGAKMIEIDLTRVFDLAENSIIKPLFKTLGQNRSSTVRFRTAHGNVKARLRMAFGTYLVANLVNGMVLSTDNYSEYWMGFWTLHGDVGDFGLIQELWKGDELPAIAKFLKVPKEIIEAEPTDGLGVCEGGDAAQIGAPYPIVDDIIKKLMKNGIDLNGAKEQLKRLPKISPYDSDLVFKIAERGISNAFKRKTAFTVTRNDLNLD